jgi:hypothetical protein
MVYEFSHHALWSCALSLSAKQTSDWLEYSSLHCAFLRAGDLGETQFILSLGSPRTLLWCGSTVAELTRVTALTRPPGSSHPGPLGLYSQRIIERPSLSR